MTWVLVEERVGVRQSGGLMFGRPIGKISRVVPPSLAHHSASLDKAALPQCVSYLPGRREWIAIIPAHFLLGMCRLWLELEETWLHFQLHMHVLVHGLG